MAGYIGKSGIKKIANCMVGVNGKPCNVKSIWTGKNGAATKIWESKGSGIFAAIKSTGEIFVSQNGTQWTKTATVGESTYLMTYGDGKFVCVGSGGANGGRSYYSADGVTWTESSGLIIGKAYYDLCFHNGRFICVGFQGDYYSTDGIIWAEMNRGTAYHGKVCGGGGIFVSSSSDLYMHYSADGINWIDTSYKVTGFVTKIIYGDNKFLAITANNYVYQSANGKNWSQISTINQSGYGFNAAIYTQGKFWGVIRPNECFWSINGATWNKVQIANSTMGAMGLNYGAGIYVCAIYNMGLYQSHDGLSWSPVSGVSGTYNCIAFSTDGGTAV